jgi:anaerobic dimethyl sulfoxide reductase subunit B (iron-sulfur subunit)
MKQVAFYFDSRSCSGCKACQVACKDQNGLEVGLLWRRVYEVTGGGWEKSGAAWVSSVFSYNLSIACNHCEQPICAEVCPTAAIHKRADGIVLIDGKRCTGCQYCSWACPYGAPQFDRASGRMTKCNLCVERIDASLSPACVAACPLRSLDFGERSELEARYGASPAIYPLPAVELTGPALIITPHLDFRRAAIETAQVTNREEVNLGKTLVIEALKIARQGAVT